MFGKPGGANGMLIMLKALGLEGVIDAAQKMSDAKSVNKILEFADALPQLAARLERIERYLVCGGAFVEPGSDPDASANGEPGPPAPRTN